MTQNQNAKHCRLSGKAGFTQHIQRSMRFIFRLLSLGIFGVAACIELPEPVSKAPPLDEAVVLLDVVSNISTTQNTITLEWNGAPLAGRPLHFVFQHNVQSAARVPRAALQQTTNEGSWSEPQPIVASLARIPNRPGNLSILSVEIPKDTRPGPVQLSLTLGEYTFPPIQLEVTVPTIFLARQQAYQQAQNALQEIAGDQNLVNWAALYTPLPTGSQLIRGQTGLDAITIETDNTWAFEATIFDMETETRRTQVIVANQAGVLLMEDSNGESHALKTEQGIERNHLPSGPYNGWFWHPDGSVHHYPDTPREVVLATPDTPILRGSYNGWFWHPNGGTYRYPAPRPRPIPKPKQPKKPDVPGTQEKPDPVKPPIPPRFKPPTDEVKKTFTPSEYVPLKYRTKTCSTDFVETFGFNYRSYYNAPIRRRVKPGLPGPDARMDYTRLPAMYADVYFTVARTSPRMYIKVGLDAFMGPFDDFAWTPPRIEDAIKRAIRWYAQYCVYLTFHRVDPPELKPDHKVLENYKKWIKSLPSTTGKGITGGYVGRGHTALLNLEAATRKALPNKGALAVIFMDRVVDRNSKGYVQASRPTEASLAITRRNAIAMHAVDADDPYVLSHELIHALGRNAGTLNIGKYSWQHSPNRNAMSHLTRKSILKPSGLNARREWDFAEYIDAVNSGQLRSTP
ncbi:hypothetical protein [Kordiimonas aquimaris]|uniref:hypothetical protein n=1 Tax=Kordiimonas aquimaris TaxID=707591 RepID=UPI0021CFF070|nr:hypothetical protein [Kordiimonas aquimaris]